MPKDFNEEIVAQIKKLQERIVAIEKSKSGSGDELRLQIDELKADLGELKELKAEKQKKPDFGDW